MEIKGSSTPISALKSSQQLAGRIDSAISTPNQEPVEPNNGSVEPETQSPELVEEILAQTGLTQLSTLITPDAPATDIRAINAINAYTQELNQPLLEQRNSLIVGIDFYV